MLTKIGDFFKNIFRFLVRQWKFTVPVVLGLLGLGIWLVFFYFAFHLYFIDDTVDEDVIVFDSGLVLDMEDDEPDNNNETTTTTAAPQTQTSQSQPAEFVSRSHGTSGQAYLITDGNQIFLRINDLDTDNGPDLDVYLVPFAGDASASLYDDDFVNLGDLKGNKGDQNYEIPAGTDLDKYSTVVIWCVRFSVAFGTAELNPLS